MAFLTYILLNCVLAGVKGSFHPKLIQSLMSSTVAYLAVELLLLKLGTYVLTADSKVLDFFAYSGYKFIGYVYIVFFYLILLSLTTGRLRIIVTILVRSLFPHASVKWVVFLYTATSNSFFLLRSLRYVLLPDTSTAAATSNLTATINSGQRHRRIQFLFVYSFVCQFVLMWFLL